MQRSTFFPAGNDWYLHVDDRARGRSGRSRFSIAYNSISSVHWPLLWRRLSVVLKKEGVVAPRFATTAYPSR